MSAWPQRVTLAIACAVALTIPSLEGRADNSQKRKSASDLLAMLTEIIEPWLGTPYHWGRAEKKVATDCSGFTKAVMEDLFVIELPRSSREQMKLGRPIKRAQLIPGDLVFFSQGESREVKHVGIYMGQGKFVHASRTRGVVYDDMRFFPGHYRGARRLVASESRLNASDRKSTSQEAAPPTVPLSARDRGLLCL